jgi:lysophospholipase
MLHKDCFLRRYFFIVSFYFIGLCLAINVYALDYPSGGNFSGFSYLQMTDGSKLRVASWKALSHVRKGLIVLATGRGSYMEKNLELVHHGGSTRIRDGSQKCHIDSFETYLSDFNEYVHQIKNKRPNEPIYLIGVSMGGHLSYRYVHDNPNAFAKVILTVPMFEVRTDPFPRPLVEPMTAFACAISFSKVYAFGYGDVKLTGPISPTSKETHDNKRHIKTHEVMRAKPELVLGGPTLGWVNAAFDSIAITKKPNYNSDISVPVMVQTAGQDKTVDTSVDAGVCSAMKKCTHKLYPESFHNITKEIDPIRNEFLQDIDAFFSAKNEMEG